MTPIEFYKYHKTLLKRINDIKSQCFAFGNFEKEFVINKLEQHYSKSVSEILYNLYFSK